jgi:hypothetical protein
LVAIGNWKGRRNVLAAELASREKVLRTPTPSRSEPERMVC